MPLRLKYGECMFCLLITMLIFISFYFALSRSCRNILIHKIIISFLLTCSQIVLTELSLGLLNKLYLSNLVIANVLLSVLIIISACKSRFRETVCNIKDDFKQLKQGVAVIFDNYNVTLLTMICLAYSWILVASYYLPPRGVDDLVYHLPPIFEYIQSHKISSLPVEIRTHFAFPQNAELLFMWPSIFSHDQRMIDGVNIPFVFFSIAIVYALLNKFNLSKKDSFFAAMLYALCPNVLMQAGSSYIDIMVSLFFLIGLYYAVLYYDSPRDLFLYASAVAVGMACGMKYTSLALTFPIHVLVFWRTRERRLHLAGYVITVLLLCGWWYLRNAMVLGSPFYPMDFGHFFSSMPGDGGGGKLFKSIQTNLSKWILHYPLEDVGIGSYDGGFGLVFWGLGFLSWFFVSVRAVASFRKTGLTRLFFLAQLPIGFLMLLCASENNVDFVSRLSMFIVAVSLYALFALLDKLNDAACKSVIKIVCIVLSAITLCLMAISDSPSYRLDDVIRDRVNNKNPSEYKYIMNSARWYSELRYVWEPLDYITRDDTHGLNCYLAADLDYFIMAPLYGSKLQNRMAILNKSSRDQVDALIYSYHYKNIFGGFVEPNIYYYDLKLDLEDVLASDDFVTVTKSENGCLVLKKSVLNDVNKLMLLKSYYKNTWPKAIIAANQIMKDIIENLPIITSNDLAYGIRYINTDNAFSRVILTPNRMEENVARKKGIKRCYSFDKPLSGYTSKMIASTVYEDRTIGLYLNFRE
jgi:Dolichyl-phosphate-mannose-protein mannosyltransferase